MHSHAVAVLIPRATWDAATARGVLVRGAGQRDLTQDTMPAAGPVQVVVVTNAGESQPVEFTYVLPPVLPIVDSVTPSEGPLAGGTEVLIAGSNFTDITGVTFGGIPSTDWEVL